MIIKYKKTELDIYINQSIVDYDLNKSIDISDIAIKFNYAISRIGLDNNKIEYWSSKISERNTLNCDLFLEICNIEFILNLFNENKFLELHTNNPVYYIFFKKKSKISLVDKLKFIILYFLNTQKTYVSSFLFLMKNIYFYLTYFPYKKLINFSNHTIIQTWTNLEEFSSNTNGFKNDYNKELISSLKKEKDNVKTWFIPIKKINNKIFFSFIKKNRDKFFIMEDYMSISDYFLSFIIFIKTRFMKINQIEINKSNYTDIFRYYQKKETANLGVLIYFFIRRLNILKYSNVNFFIQHENDIFEKSLIFSARKYIKSVKLIGHFHTTKPRNLLCLDYANIEEFTNAPKPDLIIFNSDRYKIFFEKKYTGLPFLNGISLKQQKYDFNIPDKNYSKNRFILVILPGAYKEAVYILKFLNSANLKDVELIFKPHPMERINISNYYFADNFRIIEELDSINSLGITKVLSGYSGLAVELYLSGLNIGLIYNKNKLLINPFDDTQVNDYALINDKLSLEKFISREFLKNKVNHIFNDDLENYDIFLSNL